MTCHDFLKKMIKEELSAILDEKPKTGADARSEKLALYVGQDTNFASSTVYILFDAAVAEQDIVSGKYWRSGFSVEAIKAYIRVEKPGRSVASNGAKEVKNSAAVDKYGPMLYDIVMGREGGLMSDRSEVSSAAQKVWNYYDKNRSDVKKKPLDNYYEPKTKTKKDDGFWMDPETAENPLNKAYFQKPKATKALENNFLKFMAVATKEVKKQDILSKLQDKGYHFFQNHYNS